MAETAKTKTVKATPTQKGKQIVNELNKGLEGSGHKELKTTKNALGEDVIVTAQDNGDGTETLAPLANPSSKSQYIDNADLLDTYYPALISKLVSQQVEDQMRGTEQFLEIVNKEEWVNGLKTFLYMGILDIKTYDKTIAITDWNPEDPSMYEDQYKVLVKDYVNIKITIEQIITAFTKPENLSNFVNLIIAQLSKTFDFDFQTKLGKMFVDDFASIQADPKLISLRHDLIINTKDESTERVLQCMQYFITEFGTASSEHLALNDPTVKYQASRGDLTLSMSNNFARDAQNINSKLFNYAALVKDLGAVKEYGTNSLEGIDKTEVKNFKGLIMDNRKFRWGFQIQGFNWNFKGPKGQQIQELHNWYGFAALHNYTSVMFRDVTGTQTTPPAYDDGYGKYIDDLNAAAPLLPTENGGDGSVKLYTIEIKTVEDILGPVKEEPVIYTKDVTPA